jgi:hypothetical protein
LDRAAGGIDKQIVLLPARGAVVCRFHRCLQIPRNRSRMSKALSRCQI